MAGNGANPFQNRLIDLLRNIKKGRHNPCGGFLVQKRGATSILIADPV